MAVLAQYTPPPDSQYGRSANLAFSGINEGLSLMERKQAMSLRQQQADQQKAEFIAKLPLIQAQTTLSQVNAAAAVKNATDITQWESEAAAQSVAANKEFIDAIQYNVANEEGYSAGAVEDTPEGAATQAEQSKYDRQVTLDTRAQKLANLAVKYSYMKNLPQYAGFIDRVNKEAAQAHEASFLNLKLEEMQQRAKDSASAGIVKEQIKAGAKATSADTYTASRERIAQINNDTKLTMQDKAARIAQEKTGATLADLQSRAAEADQAAAEASASGDEDAAAIHRQVASSYRDEVQKQTTFAGQAPRDVPKTSPKLAIGPAGKEAISAEQQAFRDVQAAPVVAPTKVDEKATEVSIGGKTYPIYKDKNGRRAYLVDGHYVPIDTQ